MLYSFSFCAERRLANVIFIQFVLREDWLMLYSFSFRAEGRLANAIFIQFLC